MADPRFFENRGPFTLAQICEKSGIVLPADADGTRPFADLADLLGASPAHITFFSGGAKLREAFAASQAGLCLISPTVRRASAPAGMILLETASVLQGFAAIAQLFYPEHSKP